ncbi:hypothetical protein [Lacisediminihabitans changchengi]|uniref:Uncharacterized protein n=1 Tax=Lacisediminihabitans changchengi TaxID=2787634 RepID=A0A934STW2_9MICO|nr:hypothetical protein [Lacisediminihabitans changchengi]MBK4346479.1 hypothetical protein [Lacisediminihabitans changchengi]MBK4348893.1 hypothetical protein [Lacisediminihabitans changchengi]
MRFQLVIDIVFALLCCAGLVALLLKRRWVYWALLAFGLVLLGINTWLFTLGAWAD